MAGSVFVVGTFDTKGAELGYVRDLVRAAGVPVRTVDLGTSGSGGGADVPPADVAAWHPGGAAAVFTGDRGSSVAAMAVAFERYARDRAAAGDVAGMIGLGGSGGTALVTPGLRALPVGVPKIMVSTVASGDVSPYVGATDVTMMYAVTDVAGLNSVSRRVLGNAAHAIAGMAAHTPPEAADLPAVGLTMFGVTTPCVTAVVERLGDAYDELVFHATGTGGMSMEKLVDDGLIAAVLDISTTEVCDLIAGGVMSAGEDRLGAIARTGVPYVGSCGALDMVNFGAPDTVPERYRGRLLYPHNPQVTLMRTSPEECAEIGAWIAAKLNACGGPVRFLIPRGGVSMLDAPDQPFWDPRADDALFGALERHLVQTDDRRLVALPYNINDPEFADALVAAFREVTGETGEGR
ncbi:MAG TPA: Tm-1-like ATP-binding domain-containing protein [Streptosporangiaceae bacterium]|jgi:uncharacterized protein (UPF0261 family)